MKNFKRWLSGVLAVTMIFSAGCSEKADDESNDSKETTTTTTTASQTTTTTADDDPEKPVTDEKEDTVHPLESEPESSITPAMWKLETESGATIYFMGSMHALPDEAYSFPGVIMDAYNSSDAIAVECDTVEYAADINAQIALSESMMYTDGTSISDHISGELYDEVVKKMKDWGIYMSAYDYFKPAMWQSLIESYLMEASGFKAENSFDEFFLKKAKLDGKEVIEIESVEAQMEMLFGFSDLINELILESYVTYTEEEYTEELNKLYENWSTGDYEAVFEADQEMDKSLFTEDELEAYEEYNKLMMTDRNKIHADKLIELSKGDKNIFYYVGVAHFGGEDGILALLDDAGIEYERVEY